MKTIQKTDQEPVYLTKLSGWLDESQLRNQNVLIELRKKPNAESTEIKILEKRLTSPKFKNVPTEYKFDYFSDTLKVICALTGIKTLPDTGTLITLAQTFNERYSHLTMAEFEYAFKLNLYNEYPKRISPFNAFDLDFMTAILECYKVRVKNAIINLGNPVSNSKQIEPPKPVTDPEEIKKLSSKIQETISKLSYKAPVSVPKINNHKFFDAIQNEPDRKELIEKIIPNYSDEMLENTYQHYKNKLNEFKASGKLEYQKPCLEIIREFELEIEMRRLKILHIVK